MRLLTGLAASFVLLAVSMGCGSSGVAKDERIVVVVSTSPNVNASSGTPQPVQIRVWGVQDKVAFDRVAPVQLVEGDVASLERQGIGRAFESPAWVRPGGSVEATSAKTTEENQYSHVAVVVRYPQPKVESVALDAKPRTGYTVTGPEHRVTFTLEGDTVRVGGAEPAAR